MSNRNKKGQNNFRKFRRFLNEKVKKFCSSKRVQWGTLINEENTAGKLYKSERKKKEIIRVKKDIQNNDKSIKFLSQNIKKYM